MSAEHLGSEALEPEGYLQPTPYRVRCLCHDCGHEYTYTTTKLVKKNRPCPRRACREALAEAEIQRRAENLAKILLEQRAPATIGDKVIVKAIDETAKIVMEDHGKTDLRDNIRTGDSMVRPLPPTQQKKVDGFFSGSAVREQNGLGKRQMEAIKARALAGAYRNMAVAPNVVLPPAFRYRVVGEN